MPNKNTVSVQLADVSVALTHPTFDASNNRIYFREAGPTLFATIPPGVYDLDALIPAITLAMNTAGTYSYVASESSGKLVITANSPFTMMFSSRDQSASYRLGWGDSWSGASSKSVDSTLNAVQIAPFSYNLSPPSYLYLNIGGLSQCLSGRLQPISFSYPLILGSNSYGIGNTSSMLVHENVSFSSSSIDVSIRDEIGNSVDVLDWGLTLKIF